MKLAYPKVSIITTTYNGSKYIGQTIDSVLKQNYNNFEYIIINDNSSDDVEKVIKQYMKNDKRIIYIKNDINLERAISRNNGINISQGTYIAFIDDDDIWSDTNKLLKQVDFLENNKDYGFLGTHYSEINGIEDEIGKNFVLKSYNSIKKYMLLTNWFCFSSILARKRSIIEAGNFNEDRNIIESEDYDLWLRLGRDNKFANIEDFCVKYRVYDRNQKLKKKIKKRINSLNLCMKNKKYYPNFVLFFLTNIILFFIPKCLVSKLSKTAKNIFMLIFYKD